MEAATPRRSMGVRLVCATPHRGNAIVNYSLGDKIGKGAFASVYKAIDLKTGGVVAIKQIPTTNIPSSVESVTSEIELLQDLEHPNIVKYLGFMKMDDMLHIVLEYCENGSLSAICKKFGVFPENLVAMYMAQVLAGLEYLHRQGTIHRDIKGANILTTKDGTAKLADFGVATSSTVTGSGAGLVGTPHWMAPEVIQLEEPTPACDVWSLGCTIIELRTGAPPYSELTDYGAMYATVQNDMPPIPVESSGRLRDFLTLCFQKDPNLRTTAAHLLEHPWIRRHSTAPLPPDATVPVKEWNSSTRRRKLQVPSRLNLHKAYAELDVDTDPAQISAPQVPVKKAVSHRLQAYVEQADEFDDFDLPGVETTSPEPFPAIPSQANSPPINLSSSPGGAIQQNSLAARADPFLVDEEDAAMTSPKQNLSVVHAPVAQYGDDDDFDEFANQLEDLQAPPLGIVPGHTVADDSDPFEGFEEILEEAPLERVVAAHEETSQLIKAISLNPDKADALENVYGRLCELVVAEPSVKRLLSQERILSYALPSGLRHLDVLAEPVLDLVLLLVEGDPSMLETFSLSEGLNFVLKISHHQPLRSIILLTEFSKSYMYGSRLLMSRTEVIGFLCACVAAGGSLSTKGSVGDDETGIILTRAAECIMSIFKDFGPRKRAELWYIFGKMGLFELVVAALDIDAEHPALNDLYTIISSFSKNPPGLITEFVTKKSLRLLMKAYRHLNSASRYRVKILHFYKDLSTIPEVLDIMEKGSLGPYFIQILRESFRNRTEFSHAMAASLLPLFYNYCCLSKSRQTETAAAGIIPLLQATSQIEPGLKEFSIPILCAMAHNCETWDDLWRNDGLMTLVGLITERGWESPAVAAITTWMCRQPQRVQPSFVKLGGVTCLIQALRDSRNETFSALITSVSTLLETPTGMLDVLPYKDLFALFIEQINRTQASTTLVKILQVIRNILQALPDAYIELQRSGLDAILSSLESQDELPIICKRLAKQIGSLSQSLSEGA